MDKRGRALVSAVLLAVLSGCGDSTSLQGGTTGDPDGGIAASCRGPFTAYEPPVVSRRETVLSNIKVAMSDGTLIALDVHLPADLDGPLPTIVSITGYGKSGPVATFENDGFTDHGYALVIVDDRGTEPPRPDAHLPRRTAT